MSWRKKIIIIICVLIIIGIFDYWLWAPRKTINHTLTDSGNKEVIEPKNLINKEFNNATNENKEKLRFFNNQSEELLNRGQGTTGQAEIEPSVLLFVPFTSQAPYTKWDQLYNEACEEAVLIMARAWLKDEKLTAGKVDEEIRKAVAWQEKHWGGHYDLPVEKIVELAKEFFQIEKIRLEYGIEINDIKRELSNGHLVIVPTAGRILENPYYRQPGPYYHMLVVIGYNGREMITNDPGTKRGQGFKYSYENFYKAIHDWPGPFGSTKDEVNILAGRKAMIIIEN